MEKFTPFNLNENIKVKIKQKGYEHLSKNHNEISEWSKGVLARKFDYEFEKDADEEGYTTFQAHEFITQFGSLGMDLHSYIDINILIGGKQ